MTGGMKTILKMAAPLALLAALPGCGDSPDALLDQARASFAAQDYEAARLQLASALQQEPENPRLLLMMAQTQLALGDADAVEGILGRLARTGTRAAELPRMKAQLALLRHKPDEALALIKGDATPDGWRIRAEAQLALGDEAGAARSFEQGMAAGDDIRLAAAFARYRLSSDDPAGAAVIYRRMKAMAPDGFETLVLGGDIAAGLGQADGAIGAYRQAIQAFPGRIAPMLALANQYDVKGQVDQALKIVEQAEKLAPEDEAVQALKFQLWSEKGEWEKIRLALQKRETQLEPGSGLQMTYAEALLRLGHAEQARLMFKRAALALPGNPYSRMMMGEAQLATGDASGAWTTLAPLAASTLARPEVLEVAAKAALAAGAPEAASLQARLDPARLKVTMALVQQGEAAMTHREWASAIAIYGRLLQQGNDPEVLKRLAMANSKLGRTKEAIGYADRAVAASPENPDFLYLAGVVRVAGKQDLAAARQLLENAAALDPGNRDIARELLKAKAAAG